MCCWVCGWTLGGLRPVQPRSPRAYEGAVLRPGPSTAPLRREPPPHQKRENYMLLLKFWLQGADGSPQGDSYASAVVSMGIQRCALNLAL